MKLNKLIFCLILSIPLQLAAFDLPKAGPSINEDLLYDRKFRPEIFKEAYKYSLEEEKSILAILGKKQKLVELLGNIKFSLLNGNIERAKVDLLKIKSKEKFVINLKLRYLAIIYFLENDFNRSLELLSDRKLESSKSFSKICMLKTINMIILDHKDLKETWFRCFRAINQFATTEGQWIDNLVQLRTNKVGYVGSSKIKKLKSLGYDSKYIKLYLKLALYMNQEDSILTYIETLPEEFFTDNEIREIMGHIYYRRGKLGEAFDFLEDLESVNAENIKGNIYLADEKYELAYAQFKLALKQKSDSYNALERAIPLAWLLEQYNDGVDFAKRFYKTEKNKVKKLALLTALYIKLGNFKDAQLNLEEITLFAKYSQPFEINQLYSYTALMNQDLSKTKIYADLACKKLDPINCWTLMQTSIWEDFSLTIKRDEPINYDSVALLDTLTSSKIENSIDEAQYIDQKDIEELDDHLIKISTPKD